MRVVVETGTKRVFASAVDWPGWCRAGKTEQLAIETLANYAPRYEVVAARAGHPLPTDPRFQVIERLPGNATTDFGAPDAHAAIEWKSMSPGETDVMCELIVACWDVFDQVVKKAPAELRKGPRGGGRNRDRIVDHVFESEAGYSRMLGLRLKPPGAGDRRTVPAHRDALLDAFRRGANGKPLREGGWPARYAARRIAWHALDHTWEIEDRTDR